MRVTGLDFTVEEGEVVVILGANGAGKTTTLRAVCGMIDAEGEVVFDGRNVVGRRSDQIAQAGIGHVPQGRGTIVDLTVDDNLRSAPTGGATPTSRATSSTGTRCSRAWASGGVSRRGA